MKKLDFLFLCPLSWDRTIWDNVLKNNIFKDKNCDFIEFKGGSFYKDKDTIFSELSGKINNLVSKGTVICSSFGTVVFLNFINSINANIKNNFNLILLDGIDTVEDKEDLKKYFLENTDTVIYKSKEQYFKTMLSEDELNNDFLLSLLEKNIYINDKREYELITKNNDFYNYLSNFSNVDNRKLLYSHYQKFNKVYIFSNTHIDSKSSNLQFIKIKPEQHLLMLTDPENILEIIALING